MMYRRRLHRPNGPFESFRRRQLNAKNAPQKSKGSGPGGPLPLIDRGEVRSFRVLAERVADGVELRARLATQGGQGDDADDGDQSEQEGVLHQGGATLGVAEASTQVRGEGAEDVHF